MASMPAYRIIRPGEPPQWCEVDVPRPRAGEVLVRMGGAGLCRTDLEVIDHGTARAFAGPFTLGHENAGWIEAVGPAVSGLSVGDAVVISAIRGCGHCPCCSRGFDNYCEALPPRGLGADGGIAPFMIGDARQTVVLDGLDPRKAAPLADAGLTGFAAAASVETLLHAGSRVAVVGVGGLGLLAVQFLRLLAPGAWILAVDLDQRQAADAVRYGADDVLVGDDIGGLDAIDGSTGWLDAVLDFVATDATLAWANRMTRSPGAIVVCGRGGGVLPFSRETVRPGVDLRSLRGGTVDQLRRAVSLARDDRLRMPVTSYPFREAARAYGDLRRGAVRGRAVLVF